jgi:hypothetical protein
MHADVWYINRLSGVQVLRMRLAVAEAASQGHVALGAVAEATEGVAHSMEARFGKEAVAAAGGAVATGTNDDAAVCSKLFSGMVFWLAREVPREVHFLTLCRLLLSDTDMPLAHHVLFILDA